MRKRSRCQRSRVSGCTMCSACCQNPVNLVSKTRRSRSLWVSCGRFTCRLSTINCCRSIAFSMIRSLRQPFRSERVPTARAPVAGLLHFLMLTTNCLIEWIRVLSMPGSPSLARAHPARAISIGITPNSRNAYATIVWLPVGISISPKKTAMGLWS